jgi:RimJ/RimL family protein N-acetyltransferase
MDRVIKGVTRNIYFRLVDESDAQFIHSLRNDCTINRYLSPVSDDVVAQKEWLKAYKQRERRKEEYYFIVTGAHGDEFGTIRLYDFIHTSFVLGSWILKKGTPRYVAIESLLFATEIGFYRLGFDSVRVDVHKENMKVLSNEKRLGGIMTGEDDAKKYFRMDKLKYEHYVKKKYIKFYVE